MITFEFDGMQFEADDDALTDYDFICDVLTADEDPKALVHCFRRVFAGKDKEYAKAIGGKFARMGELLKAAFDAVGDTAKN